MALMEWEFTEGPGNEGYFMATGKVIETLRRHLARNEIDEAVGLYETCVQQSVGQELWQEFTTASKPMKKAIANLFYRSRDYRRAGEACEQIGEWSAAAKAYAAAFDWPKAAECVGKTGDRIRAAEMFQKGGQPRRAAELYFEANRMLEAAEALELSEDLVGAGQLFVRAGDQQRAANVLSRVTMRDPRFTMAVGMLTEILVGLNRRDVAVRRLSNILPDGQPIADPAYAELGLRLGQLLNETGRPHEARAVFDRVAAFDPRYRDAIARLQSAPSAHAGRAGPAPRVVPGRPLPPSYTDPFAALAGNPFAPAPAAAPTGSPEAYVQRVPGYEVLKRLPIFEDLSLDQMREFYGICEQTAFQTAEVVIEQGQPGAGLFIVRSGRLRVVRLDTAGAETELAMIPPGQYVGEMSLVDDAPTSARVSAAEPVEALCIHKARFAQLLLRAEPIALRVYRSFIKTLSARLRNQNERR